MKALILFNASNQVGVGHFSRALSFGRYMRRKGVECELVHLGILSENYLQRLVSFCMPFRQNFSVAIGLDDLNELALTGKFTHVLVDVSQNFDHDAWNLDLFFEDCIVATFDDLTPFRKKADLCFYPPLKNLSKLDWHNYSGKIFSGFEYYIYRPELDRYNQRGHANYEYDICITCGGSNNASLTERVLDILKSFSSQRILVILGPMSTFQYDKAKLNNVEIVVSPEDYIGLISKSRLIINTYGVSVFELFYLSKVAIIICTAMDHNESAKMFNGEQNFSFIDISEVDHELLGLVKEKSGLTTENPTAKNQFLLNEQIYLELERAS